jgi:redox-sensing transcriptional repressor
VVKEEQVAIGIIATPAPAAQEVCDRLVAAGVTSILNFAPAHLQVPAGVSLRKVDLSTELQILSFHEQRRAAVDLVRQVAARNRDAGPGPTATDEEPATGAGPRPRTESPRSGPARD